MLVTLSGIVTVVNDVQYLKAPSPILSIWVPKETLASLEQLVNAYAPIVSQTLPASNTTLLILPPLSNRYEGILLTSAPIVTVTPVPF